MQCCHCPFMNIESACHCNAVELIKPLSALTHNKGTFCRNLTCLTNSAIRFHNVKTFQCPPDSPQHCSCCRFSICHVAISLLVPTLLPAHIGMTMANHAHMSSQCLPTQAVTKRETGRWRWAIFQLVYMTIIAYVAALITFQSLSAFGLHA